jgi:myosin heavy subunit
VKLDGLKDGKAVIAESQKEVEDANAQSQLYKEALNEKETKSDVKRLEREIARWKSELAKRAKDYQKVVAKQAGELDKKDEALKRLEDSRRQRLTDAKSQAHNVKNRQSQMKAQEKAFGRTSEELKALLEKVSNMKKDDKKKDKFLHKTTKRLVRAFAMLKSGSMAPDESDMAWELHATKKYMGDKKVPNMKHGLQMSEKCLSVCATDDDGSELAAPNVSIPSAVILKSNAKK